MRKQGAFLLLHTSILIYMSDTEYQTWQLNVPRQDKCAHSWICTYVLPTGKPSLARSESEEAKVCGRCRLYKKHLAEVHQYKNAATSAGHLMLVSDDRNKLLALVGAEKKKCPRHFDFDRFVFYLCRRA